MSRFFITFFSLYATAHAYVLWRIVRLPWVREHRWGLWIVLIAIILGAGYPLSRALSDNPTLSRIMEILGGNWMGMFLLLFTAFLVLDVVTLGGWLWRSQAVNLSYGALAVGLGMSLIAFIQGHRTPVVTEYELTLAGLPKERDGFRLAAISDLHLGTQFKEAWLEEVVEKMNGLKPDAMAIVGDLIDRDARVVVPMTPILGRLNAPHGVFSVAGNHEYYADEALSMRIMADAGYIVLRNRAQEILPGLHMAGVDDLTIAMRGNRGIEPLLQETLAGSRPGATVLLSHTPLAHAYAASQGAALMISGHTHDGQIWPFRYFVRTRYPITYGLEKFGQMTALVTRGAGGWGPRMRLWFPGEIVLITLRSPER